MKTIPNQPVISLTDARRRLRAPQQLVLLAHPTIEQVANYLRQLEREHARALLAGAGEASADEGSEQG